MGLGKDLFIWELHCACVLAVTVLPKAVPALLVEALSMLCAPSVWETAKGHGYVCVVGGDKSFYPTSFFSRPSF